jgi:hypothetical protein
MQRDGLMRFIDGVCLEVEESVVSVCRWERGAAQERELLRAVIDRKESWQRAVLEDVRRLAREKLMEISED